MAERKNCGKLPTHVLQSEYTNFMLNVEHCNIDSSEFPDFVSSQLDQLSQCLPISHFRTEW